LVGEAAAEWQAIGKRDPVLDVHVEPFAIQQGDFLTHPLFPTRALTCIARHIDLVKREVEVFMDFAPEEPRPPEQTAEVIPLRPVDGK
jgi:hypothetical protein